MACTYTHEGVEYTRSEMLDLIKYGFLSKEATQAKARIWLKNKLGMTDDQIQLVSGLIDGTSFGRLMGDGNILLSSLMEEGTEYHEAFHRVYRFSIPQSQRDDIIEEFKEQSGWEDKLTEIRELYPNKDTNTLIEEYLAEEFRDYILNEGNFETKPVRKSIFARLWNMLKALLGKSGKRFTKKQLFENINNAAYKGVFLPDSPYFGQTADKKFMSMDGKTEVLSTAERNELTQHISLNTLNLIFKNGAIYDFVNGDLPTEGILTKVIRSTFTVMIKQARADKNNDLLKRLEILATDSFRDAKFSMINTSSPLFKLTSNYLKTFGIKINAPEDIFIKDDLRTEENEGGRDTAFDKISIEFDSKASMSQVIKLMLASVKDTDVNGRAIPSDKLKLHKQMKWNEVANYLTQTLSTKTASVQGFLSLIKEASAKYPALNQIVDLLGGTEYDSTNKSIAENQLRLEFVQTFAKNKYNFLMGMIDGKNIYPFDANQNAVTDKVFGEWKSSLLADYTDIVELQTHLKNANTAKEIADILRLTTVGDMLETQIEGGETVGESLFTLGELLVDAIQVGRNDDGSVKAGAKPLIMAKIYNSHKSEELKNYKVTSRLKKLASIAAKIEKPVNLQIYNAERKKIYNISINTYQSLIINSLNEIAALPTYEQRLDALKEELPHLASSSNFKDGEPTSKWLADVLGTEDATSGKAIEMHVFDGAKILGQDGKAFSDLKESDILAFTINAALKGINFSMKHSDRSTFFAYASPTRELHTSSATSKAAIQEIAANELWRYLKDEVVRTQRLLGDEKFGADIQRFNKNAKNLTIFSFLLEKTNEGKKSRYIYGETVARKVEKLMGTEADNLDSMKKQFMPLLKQYLNNEEAELKASMAEWGLLDRLNSKPVGIDEAEWSKYEESVPNIIAAANANAILGHIEETKTMIGDMAYYKNADDLYKRLSMQSSTGEIAVVDEETNAWLAQANRQEGLMIANPRKTGAAAVEAFSYADKPTDGSMSELILEEGEYFQSNSIAELKQIFEAGLGKAKLSKEQVDKMVAAYLKSYGSINEADGQSYLNIFGWREFMYRAGKWNQQLENTFQIELAILPLTSRTQLKDATAYYLKDEGGNILAISATPKDGYVETKIFDMRAHGRVDAASYLSKIGESSVPLKPQYTGPMMRESITEYRDKDINERDYVVAGRKTSYMVLMPSTILGTNLQQMNSMMLRNGVDAIHMGSAAKFGNIDARAVSENEDIQDRGLDFYSKEGDFNDIAIEAEMNKFKTFLDYRYMKHQTGTSSKPKTKIKNSTQAMKIIMSNLTENNVPRDVSVEDTVKFLEADLVEKAAMSPLFHNIMAYQNALNHMIKKNRKKLLDLLGTNETDMQPETQTLIDALREEAIDRGEATNILEAIDRFIDSPYLETMPNKTKIENILFAMVSNKALDYKRPGTMIPQIAPSGFEKNQRAFDEDGKMGANDSAVPFYKLKDDGSLKPAEAKMPLPKPLLKKVMRAAKTGNIVEAIDWLNAKIDESSPEFDQDIADSFTWKTLRIPNQQLGSSGVYRINEFFVPTHDAFIIVPSENVVKTGGDFDIDKLSIYFQIMDENLKVKKFYENPTDAQSQELYYEYIADNYNTKDEFSWAKKMGRYEEIGLVDDQLTTQNIQFSNALYNELKRARTNAYNEYLKSNDLQEYRNSLTEIRRRNLNNTVFYQLPAELKQGYYRINREYDNHFDKIMQFQLLTEANMLNDHPPSVINILKTMMNEYEIDLKANEVSDQTYKLIGTRIKEHMKTVNAQFDEMWRQGKRELKETKRASMLTLKEDIRKEILEGIGEDKGMNLDAFKKLDLHEQHSKDRMSNRLLQVEMDLLLSKDNAHIFLAPLVDDILAQDAVRKIIGQHKKGDTKAKALKTKPTAYTDQTTYRQSMGVVKNMVKTLLYIGGKTGIGPGALAITGHSQSMIDGIRLNDTYESLDSSDAINSIVSTLLPFEIGADNSLTRMLDNDGNNIMEVLSALITSQVDGAKNPYPVEIGINNQTLGLITYLTRRGIPIMRTLLLTSQPLVQEYLKQQRINESIITKATGGELSKKDLIEKVMKKAGYTYKQYKGLRSKAELGQTKLTDKIMEQGIEAAHTKGSTKVTLDGINQGEFLAVFLHLVEQAKVFSKYQKDASPDTQRMKDMATFDIIDTNATSLDKTGLIANPTDYKMNGLLKEFHNTRAMYRDLYHRFYITRNFKGAKLLASFKEQMAEITFGEDATTRLLNTIDNDFVMYAMTNKSKEFGDRPFDKLMKGPNSVAKQIRAIKNDPTHELHDNYAIKELFPVIKNTKDQSDDKFIDNIRLFHTAINSYEANDLIEAMEEIESYYEINTDVNNLFKDLVIMNYYQTGLNNGPFNFDKILPTDYRYDILTDTVELIRTKDVFIKEFKDMFQRANPKFLPKTYGQAAFKKMPFYTTYDRVEGMRMIKATADKSGNYTVARGDNFSHVRYDKKSIRTNFAPKASAITSAQTPQLSAEAQEAEYEANWLQVASMFGGAANQAPAPTQYDNPVLRQEVVDNNVAGLIENHGGLNNPTAVGQRMADKNDGIETKC